MQKIVFLLLLISNISFAQNQANIWELGDNVSMGTIYPAFGLDFNQGFADTFTVYRPMRFFITNASICDTSGQLLFYTNGVYIANRNHDSLLNGKDFNPGDVTDFYGDEGLGLTQAALILPKPGDTERYYIFHVSAENLLYRGYSGSYPIHLSCTEVDMNLDNGLGGVNPNFKNVIVVDDTLYKGRITACRHANGRDWWVVVKEMTDNRYYKLLVTPNGVSLPIEQYIGEKGFNGNIDGMAVFSPDGMKYAHLDINDTISLLKFDRCSGEFYDPINLAVPDSPVTLSETVGCQFSPNSRFLYVNSYRRLWQFDTWANDVQASRILIDTIDPLLIYPLFIEQLAPDGKIYISTSNSNSTKPFLHIIHEPDSLGVACHVEFDGLWLPPTTTNSAIPNFTNYDLVALAKSLCDTLFNQTPASIALQNTFRIQPNPVSDWLNIVYQSQSDGLLKLYDVSSRSVGAISLFHYFKNRLLNVAALPQGVYLAVVTINGERVWSEKVVKQ